MKKLALTLIVSIGVITCLVVSGSFPIYFIPWFTIDLMGDMGHEIMYGNRTFTGTEINLIRAKLTLLYGGIALVILASLFLLHRASRSLDLVLYKKALSGAMYYVGILTAIIIIGMWIDFQVTGYSGAFSGRMCFIYLIHGWIW